MITKVTYCFLLDNASGLGKVYIVPKRFKCYFASSSHNGNNIVCGYVNLKNNIEEVYSAVQKTNQKFSKIGLNHNHEQLNGKIKGVGGAIRFRENDSSLQRWLVACPKTAHLIDE